MRRVLAVCIVSFALFAAAAAHGADRPYRLGVPTDFTTPIYSALIASLESKGYAEGQNFIISRYDLAALDTADEAERVRIRQDINRNDLFFVTCDQVQFIYDLGVSTPILFFGAQGLHRSIPDFMRQNVTGIWKGTIKDMIIRMNRLVPDGERSALGMIYIDGTDIENMAPQFVEYAKTENITIIPKGYTTTEDLERVMREYRSTVKAVIVVPPAVTPENVPLLVNLQNDLGLPLISQLASSVEAGMFGGTVLDMQTIIPKLTEYSDKIMKGRTPSQLPIFTANLKYLINLEAASHLGVTVPRSVLKQSEIIGIAQGPAASRANAVDTVKPGVYRLAIPSNAIASVRDLVIEQLAARGYHDGRNLNIITFDLGLLDTPSGDERLRLMLRDAHVIFATDSAAVDVARLDLDVPVVFMGVSDTTPIPSEQESHFTGVWRTSCQKSLDMARRMFPDTHSITLVYKKGARIAEVLQQNRDAAAELGIDFSTAMFSHTEDIPQLMRDLSGAYDLVLLFPAGITDEDVRAFVSAQNELDLPVLSQLESHIRMGLAGGPALNLEIAVPKLAEYIDKIFQGRKPWQLKIYRFTPKYVINIGAASQIDVRLSRSIIQQSTVINGGVE